MKTVKTYFRAATFLGAVLVLDGFAGSAFVPTGLVVTDAQARVGRPATAGSVAGVARRTTRRVVRRSNVYVAGLPGGCATVSINGMAMWRCGGVYYQSYSGRYVVVYVD